MVAAGLSGPSRASVGALRDFVLGATLLNGRGEVLSFGGQVMKNVAGYDVSRLLAGSMGVLGVVLEVSLKVLPLPPAVATIRFEMDEASRTDAAQRLGRPAAAHPCQRAGGRGMLVLRLAGAHAAVDAARARLGGESVEDSQAAAFWTGLRDQRDEFFLGARAAVEAATGAALWRLSVPQTAPPLQLRRRAAHRMGRRPALVVHAGAGRAGARGGRERRWPCHAVPRQRQVAAACFAPLAAPLDRIHRELKREFDPAGMFNRGRLYPDF